MANGTVIISPGVTEPIAAPRVNRVAFALLRCGLVAGGLVVLLSYLLLATAHIADLYQINFCSSIYASLAAYLNGGMFYPELYDGAHYGGTRYMPLEFVLHAGLARLTGEYLISGKILAYSLAVALGCQLWFILRAFDCPRSVSLAAVSFLLLTECGYLACTTIRGDLLPVVFQIAALFLLHREVNAGRSALAGLLCTLAVLAKFSALWGPLAIMAYLLVRHRRQLAPFLAVLIASLGVALLCCHVFSAGRMYANFASLSLAGLSPTDALLAPLVMLWKLGRTGIAVAFLVPVLVVELASAASQRRHTLFHYALYACLGTLLVIYSDRAADSNHLLDLMVLAVVLCGSLWCNLPSLRQPDGWIRPALALAMLWVLFAGWTNALVFPVINAGRSLYATRGVPHSIAPPLTDLLTADAPILAEDPWVELSRGRLPTVLDPYALARLSASHPELTNPLVRRVEQREFPYVVLLQRMDVSSPTDRFQWEDRAFGPAVVSALRRNYHLYGEREGYFVYARD